MCGKTEKRKKKSHNILLSVYFGLILTLILLILTLMLLNTKFNVINTKFNVFNIIFSVKITLNSILETKSLNVLSKKKNHQ